MSTSLIVFGLIFGSIGFGFFLYGRKQQAPVPLVCGVLLMFFPYFITNTVVLVIVGVVLMAVPYFVRL
jgi:predicted membrane protein